MSGNPIDIDGTTTLVRRFVGDDGVVLSIEDRFYHLHRNDSQHYMMLRIGNFVRSLSGSIDALEIVAVKIHRAYRDYEGRVRRAKEDAQRLRDRQLHAIAEAFE